MAAVLVDFLCYFSGGYIPRKVTSTHLLGDRPPDPKLNLRESSEHNKRSWTRAGRTKDCGCPLGRSGGVPGWGDCAHGDKNRGRDH